MSSASAALPRIQRPCPAAWASMRAADPANARRFCDVCNKHVHNLAAMTRAQIDALLVNAQASGERLCVRYQADARGRMITPLFAQEATAPAHQRLGAHRLLSSAALIAATLGLSTPQALADAPTSDANSALEDILWVQERTAARALAPLGLELEDEALVDPLQPFTPYTPPKPEAEVIMLGEAPF